MNTVLVGSYISNLRKKRGLTQAKLGEIIGVSDKAISKWENGDGLPDVAILQSLAVALNTSVDSILNGGPIKVRRLLMSLGNDEDIRYFKQGIIAVVSALIASLSIKNLVSYVILKDSIINMTFEYGDGLYPYEGSNPFSGYSIPFIIVLLMGFSYFVYVYFRKMLPDNGDIKHFRFFESVMVCIWLAPLIYIFFYEVRIDFIDPRLIFFIPTLIFILIVTLQVRKLMK
ncbi:helix-turn-helix transcriptional regulator [Erysipelothrix sp. HDW6C]|uniref:helix-turn-helix domain-containing protein n=1 Tax=Erysipelothrix sp. HDW6C TaxID=2714930 RepID=UPI00140C3AE3|nr:helix-turn-helix transcriptional regulator [Erysipelothrix sp. HDW6C]QIK69420.1 helix-turn-helix transcriptional regulator [Erysipelothrix sp. HDW6C]